MKRLFLIISFFAFFFTFSLNIVSIFFSPYEKYNTSQNLVENTVPGYHTRIRDNINEITQVLEDSNMEFDVYNVTNLIFESLIHTSNRKIDFRENWLLWALGFIYEPISHTQDPFRIVSGGAALCNEASAVLNYIAEKKGYLTRYVGLDGHVLSEIQINNNWQLVDADYGIVFPMGYAKLIELDVEESYQITSRLLLERGFDQLEIDHYSDELFSLSNNEVTEIGMQLSPRLWLIERTAEPLKWIISLIFLIIFFFIFLQGKSKNKYNF